MRILKRIKKETQLILLSVIVLSIITLNVAYSAFFTVQYSSTIQEINTGELAVVVNNVNSMFDSTKEIYPTAVEVATDLSTGYYTTLTLENTGTVDADFLVTIGYDFDALRKVAGFENKTDDELLEDLVSFDYIKIGILDGNNNWINFTDGNAENTYPTVSSLTELNGSEYIYPILRDYVSVGNNSVYNIFIWLSDATPTTEIGKYAYIKLDVKSVAGTETIDAELNSGGNV